jgi:RNA polymerase sigma factor (sigma-70 family)
MREFEGWYRELYPQLVTTLAVSLGSRDEAAEVAGDAFASAFERWDRVGRMENASGWTYRVAMNGAKRRGRRRNAERVSAVHLAPTGTVGGENMAELRALLAPLPERMRQVVALRHVADLTEPAIAEVLGISRGTVSSTLRDAYPRLATLIESEEQQR